MGRSYDELNQDDKAIKVYEKMVELYPNSSMGENAQYHLDNLRGGQ